MVKQGAKLRGTDRLTRVGIGTGVAVNVLLAIAVTFGVTVLAGRPSLRARFDMTADQRNRLDETTETVIAQLPEKVQVDVFFRPEPPPLRAAFAEAQTRMFEILLLAADTRPDKVKVVQHDLSGASTGDSAVEQAMTALGVEQVNVFVVSAGERRVIVPIFGEVAEFDIGMASQDPSQMVPPSMVSFRGEEAFLEALLQVSQTTRPRAYFSWGQGEPDLYGDQSVELGKLHRVLVADGFEAARWNPGEDGPVPDDAAVVAILAPSRPFTADAVEWLRAYLERGGSLIVAAHPNATEDPGDAAALVDDYGVTIGKGIVCVPFLDSATGNLKEGDPKVAGLYIAPDTMNPKHPITETLRRGGRPLYQNFSRPLELTRAPDRGLLADLFGTLPESSWIEAPEPGESANWKYDEGSERIGAYLLAATCVFPPMRDGAFVPENVVRERPECRLLVTGSHFVFANGNFASNRDFALNAFNWATSREFRARISPRSIEDRRFPVGATDSLFRLHVVGSYILPLLAIVAGGFVAWRRRRTPNRIS